MASFVNFLYNALINTCFFNQFFLLQDIVDNNLPNTKIRVEHGLGLGIGIGVFLTSLDWEIPKSTQHMNHDNSNNQPHPIQLEGLGWVGM